MLSIISWRNVWRSKGRSLVVIGAIILGIWAIIFAMGFTNGFLNSFIESAINNDLAHLQIHHPEYQANQDVRFTIPDPDQKAAAIAEISSISAVSPRIVINGMIASAQTASGVEIIGIDPTRDAEVFDLEEQVVDGEYLEEDSRNQLILGSKLAEKLNVKLKSKVVLTFTDASGQMISGGFRIGGIFNTNSPVLDEGTIFTWSGNLERILGGGNYIHEIAIRIDDQEQLENVKQELKSRFPGLQVQSWKELAPEMDLLINQSSTSLLILLTIIMLALGFGIVNTMLMAVLERMKELGMLMAVGMNKSRVFAMIILETMMIALIAGPAGLLLGFITISYFQQKGMDLSIYAQSLESMGSASVLYPQLNFENYLIITAAVILTAVVGSLYPAWKAIRLKPVEALAKI